MNKMRCYQTPINKRPLVEAVVKDMLESGMIERAESPWSFSIVVVDKKTLNDILKPLAPPLHLIDNILALLGRAKCFSTIDLRLGYWQVALDKADREKLYFVPYGPVPVQGYVLWTGQ